MAERRVAGFSSQHSRWSDHIDTHIGLQTHGNRVLQSQVIIARLVGPQNQQILSLFAAYASGEQSVHTPLHRGERAFHTRRVRRKFVNCGGHLMALDGGALKQRHVVSKGDDCVLHFGGLVGFNLFQRIQQAFRQNPDVLLHAQ